MFETVSTPAAAEGLVTTIQSSFLFGSAHFLCIHLSLWPFCLLEAIAHGRESMAAAWRLAAEQL